MTLRSHPEARLVVALLAGVASMGASCSSAEGSDAGDAPLATCANSNPCGPSAACVDSPAGPLCACGPGYEPTDAGCADVDECRGGSADCDINATCTNTPGSYICNCLPGYLGNGTTCVQSEPCENGSATCDSNAACRDMDDGGFTCECNPGFTGDGMMCTVIVLEVGPRPTDGGSGDAGTTDGGIVDGGGDDAGVADAGDYDAGVADAGEHDAGVADAGEPADGGGDDGGMDSGNDDGGSEDGGVDAGPEVLDGGMDAGTDVVESVSLDVVANPTDVLSAAATVSWTGALTSLRIQYELFVPVLTANDGAQDGGADADAGPSMEIDTSDDLEAAPDAGAIGVMDGGADAGTDGGADAGADGGADAGADGGADAGADGGADAGTDGGADAGTDAGMAGAIDAGPFLWTPVTAIDESTRKPATLPVLGLQASTSYVLTGVGMDAAGNTVTSAPVTFTTGPLPTGLPAFYVPEGSVGTSGYTLVSRLPTNARASEYVTIMDETGATAWYLEITPGLGGDVQQQPDGTLTMSVDDPSDQIIGLGDTSVVYEQYDMLGNLLNTWRAVDDPVATPPFSVVATNDHEFRLQPDGTALLFGFVEKTMDLSAQGGASSARVVADVLERVSPDGGVGFTWNSFDYLSTTAIDPAVANLTAEVVDFTHANAIDVMDDGNYLVSMRNLSQIIKIDSVTGAIIWKLGGVDGDFTFPNDPLGQFSCQHGPRELPNGHIIMFDDGDGHTPKQSRAVEYELDTTAMTATLVWSSEDTPPLYSYVLGFADRLPNGNTVITYGTTQRIQEVDPSGAAIQWSLLCLTPGFGLYRSFHLDSLYGPAP